MAIYPKNYGFKNPKYTPKYINWRWGASDKDYKEWCKRIDDLYEFKRLGK